MFLTHSILGIYYYTFCPKVAELITYSEAKALISASHPMDLSITENIVFIVASVQFVRLLSATADVVV